MAPAMPGDSVAEATMPEPATGDVAILEDPIADAAIAEPTMLDAAVPQSEILDTTELEPEILETAELESEILDTAELEPEILEEASPEAVLDPLVPEQQEAEPPLIDLLASDADEPAAAAEPPKLVPAAAFPQTRGATRETEVPSWVENGEHRIVVHLLDGRVKRGMARELSAASAAISLQVRSGEPAEKIPVEQVKAVFLMLPPGAERSPPQGEKIRVMFHDGREIVGYSSDFNQSERGFSLIPADTRSNTGRIFVFRSSVHEIQPM
jgi:hypothetical protein